MNDNDFDTENKINLSKEPGYGENPGGGSEPYPQNNFPGENSAAPHENAANSGYADFGRSSGLNTSGSVPPPPAPQNIPNSYPQSYGNAPYSQPYDQGYQQNNAYQNGGYSQQPQFSQGFQQPYGQQYQQPYQQDAYQNYGGQNPYAGYSTAPDTKLATASLVLGIISIVGWIFGFMFPPLFAVPIVGLVLGIVHKSKHLPVGKGTSTAGIITSAIGIVLPVIIVILIVALMPQLLDYLKETDPETYQQIYDEYADQLPGWFSALHSVLMR